MRDMISDLNGVSDGYKLLAGFFGDDSGVRQGCSRCMIWDTNMVWDKHPLRDKSDEELAEAEARDRRDRKPEQKPKKLRDGEHTVATNMCCDECGTGLDTNMECNSGLCRSCKGLSDD